jgi:hypothetical protein
MDEGVTALGAAPDVVPELVSARMLNEYAYCPRLFFLEWVDRLWAPSSDTEEGDREHRRVDSGGGAVPLPDEGVVKAARSVELSSERLGITAKLDLLEESNGAVVPVDTKKGRPSRGRDPGPDPGAAPRESNRSRSRSRSRLTAMRQMPVIASAVSGLRSEPMSPPAMRFRRHCLSIAISMTRSARPTAGSTWAWPTWTSARSKTHRKTLPRHWRSTVG